MFRAVIISAVSLHTVFATAFLLGSTESLSATTFIVDDVVAVAVVVDIALGIRLRRFSG